ncbi:MAG: hypothetical protein AB9915_02870 [Candidatus Dojkabacteria bacterium]
MNKLKSFFEYIKAIILQWFNILFVVLDILSLIAIYIYPTIAYLPKVFTGLLFLSLLVSCFLHYEKTIKGETILVIDHKKIQRSYQVLEVYNASNFDISDIKIKAFWKQSDGEQERNLELETLPSGSNILKDSPEKLTVLQSKQKIWSVNTPYHSFDGKLKVGITGIRLDNNKKIIFVQTISIPEVVD